MCVSAICVHSSARRFVLPLCATNISFLWVRFSNFWMREWFGYGVAQCYCVMLWPRTCLCDVVHLFYTSRWIRRCRRCASPISTAAAPTLLTEPRELMCLVLGNMQLVFPWGHRPIYIHVQVWNICRKPLIQGINTKGYMTYIITLTCGSGRGEVARVGRG